jgi:iron complex outermembrane receptor protein
MVKKALNQTKKASLVFLLFFGLNAAKAQSQKVSGSVKDKITRQGIYSATVSVKGTAQGTNTDLNGRFVLNLDLSNNKTLLITYLGYKPIELQVSKNKTNIDVLLEENVVTSKTALVQSSRLTEKQKEAPLTVESMDLISIKQTSAANFYEGLGQLKGVDLTAASIGFKVINTRGFNSTSPVRSLQLIDGVDNQAPGLNFSLGNFLGSSEIDVQKVDLIVGASSAFFGPNAFNGVISMQTRNPFNSEGLTVMSKVGERGLFESAIRYARVYKNRNGIDKFAFKTNIYYMRAYDWEATNMAATPQSTVGINNPGGYDAVNRYGDENFDPRGNNSSDKNGRVNYPGLGIWHRKGYEEKDLVDYNTKNLKLASALHYKINPSTELIYAFNMGNGTTVYQGDNRYSLKDILFFQNRLEFKGENWFVRAYSTHEDAGNSYDAVFTAQLLQDLHKPSSSGTGLVGTTWSGDYRNYWANFISKRARKLPGYPPQTFPFDFDAADSVLNVYTDSVKAWHEEASYFANLGTSPQGANPTSNIYQNAGYPYVDRFEPGTERFDSAMNSITSKTSFTEGGSKFYDKSALYHLQAERKVVLANADEVLFGGNFRRYTPSSRGTIFSDTAGRVITNSEFGFYAGYEKRLLNNRLKLNATGRIDKNQNFDYVVSPAASAVYTNDKKDVFRFSFSSAIRNPTLADQFLYFNVGRARLVGNINGFDSLITVPSLFAFFNSQKLDSLQYFDVDPVKPEKVKTAEIGYRATLGKALFLDASYYFSIYTDFLGYKLGMDTKIDTLNKRVITADAYRVAANSKEIVTTQGFSVGLSYFFHNFYALTGNYSWNVLNLKGSIDPIIPAFNTPEHKFNIGLAARDLDTYIGQIHLINWSFSVNYKWIQGFQFEGSPQFTGFVPTYDLFDAQVSKTVPKLNMTFKLGASNLFDKKSYQVYGGPYVGRMAYFSATFDLAKNN